MVKALAKAQGAIGDIPRNRTVTVTPRSGGQSYKFKYATLSAIIDAIRKPLSDNAVAYTQVISHDADGGYYLLTTTLHCGEQYLSSKVPLIAEGGTNQQFGSALTYMKRYALAALLGISADEDDDGNAADGNEIKAMVSQPPKTPAPDVITTGPQTRGDAITTGPQTRGDAITGTPMKAQQAVDRLEALVGKNFVAAKLDVPLLPDESGSDWMKWGQSFMATAREAPNQTSLYAFEKANEMPLKNMELQAPKMFTNLTLALIKLRKVLEKANV